MDDTAHNVKGINKRVWLDVGAHLGETTFETARQNADITVFAFEPNLRLASQRFGLIENFIMLPMAVSEKDSFASFYVNSCDEASSLHKFNEKGLDNWVGGNVLSVNNEVFVPTTRLDTFMDRMRIATVEYLKIDAQGGDFNVLLSAGNRLSDIDRITLEVAITDEQLYRGAKDRTEIINYMASNGFQLVHESTQTFGQEANMTFIKNSPEARSPLEKAETCDQADSDNVIKGQLFDSCWVNICKEATLIGGSWQGKNPDGTPNSWDMDLVKFVYKMLGSIDNPVMLDIGANTGTFCLLASVLKNLSCHAFEPTPTIYELLCKNVELNGLSNSITTYNMAVSDHEGDTILKLPISGKESGLACIGTPTRFAEWTEFVVPTTTIDKWVENNRPYKLDFIKIDTEGCELLILKGALRTLKQFKPHILVEYNRMNTIQFGYCPSEIDGLLAGLGYKGYMVTEEDKFYCSWDCQE